MKNETKVIPRREYKRKPETGCLDIWIDKVVPCLMDTSSGELKDTAVFKIESRTYLSKFNKKNGWHINWNEVPENIEVYALALRDTNEIQGLVGVKKDKDARAAYIHWACTAPHNNKYEFGKQKYEGVGGHLFAIAVDKSVQWGYEGAVYGFAADQKLVDHYVNTFGAIHLGVLHKYQIVVEGEASRQLLEVYSYEWNGNK